MLVYVCVYVCVCGGGAYVVHFHIQIQTYIRGVFNKFPDFIVQAFKIVVDS